MSTSTTSNRTAQGWRRVLPFLVLFLAGGPLLSTLYAQDLRTTLEAVESRGLDARQSYFLGQIQERAPHLPVHLVQLYTPRRLAQTKTLVLDLGRRLGKVPFLIEEVIYKPNSDFMLKGRPRNQKGYLFLTMYAESFFGIIQLYEDARTFTVEPVGRGVHAVAEVDPTPTKPEHPIGFEDGAEGRPEKAPDHSNEGLAKSLSHPVIDVMCVYTDDAAGATANIEGICEGAVDISNDGLSSSLAPPRLNLIHMMEVAYNESGSALTDVTRLQGTNDGHMDNIHSVRNQVGADLVVLITEDMDAFGRAAAIGATASSAFAVVEWNQAIGNFTFAHEVAHLIGGHHDDDDDDPNPWARGYQYTPGNWRTILARSGLPEPRINYFSNPDNTALGVPMGTATNDVVRVWEEQGSTVAGFQTATPAVDPPSNLTITNAGNINQAPNLSWNASSTSGVSYKVQRCPSYYQSCSWQTITTTTSTSYTDYFLSISTQSNADDRYLYRIKATKSGYTTAYSNITSTWAIAPQKRGDVAATTPTEFSLEAPYPNPFNPEATIPFVLASVSQVSIEVYDLMGRRVAVLAEGRYEPGRYAVRFNAEETFPSGLYFVRAQMVTSDGNLYHFTQYLTLVR